MNPVPFELLFPLFDAAKPLGEPADVNLNVSGKVFIPGCNKNTRRCDLFNHMSVLYKRCVRGEASGVRHDPY